MNTAETQAFLKKALDAMFKVVGLRGFDTDFVRRKNWYTKREWTREQREDFRKWFIVNARRDLKWSRRTSEMEFEAFDLMWGWKDAQDRQAQAGK